MQRFAGKVSLAANTPKTVRQLILAAIAANFAMLTTDQKTKHAASFSSWVVSEMFIKNNSGQTIYEIVNPKNLTTAGEPDMTHAEIAGAAYPIETATTKYHQVQKDLRNTVWSSAASADVFIDVAFV